MSGVTDRIFRAFLSTLSLRRATHYDNYNLHCVEISIHALLAESDSLAPKPNTKATEFLSTLSLRRATLNLPSKPIDKNISIHALLAESDLKPPIQAHRQKHFYPRSPCGERPLTDVVSTGGKIFLSTLSLRRATRDFTQHPQNKLFLSTLSLRRATFAG